MNRKEILNHCQYLLKQKLANLKIELSKIQDSANQESKSSMGDKYETGRAMAQNEIDKLRQSIAIIETQIFDLSKIESSTSSKIFLGSLIRTVDTYFLIAVGLGEIDYDKEKTFVISPVSPIGKLLLGKEKGDFFNWVGKEVEILEVTNF